MVFQYPLLIRDQGNDILHILNMSVSNLKQKARLKT